MKRMIILIALLFSSMVYAEPQPEDYIIMYGWEDVLFSDSFLTNDLPQLNIYLGQQLNWSDLPDPATNLYHPSLAAQWQYKGTGDDSNRVARVMALYTIKGIQGHEKKLDLNSTDANEWVSNNIPNTITFVGAEAAGTYMHNIGYVVYQEE